MNDTTPEAAFNDARTLRLVWPQWQGAGADNAASLVPEVGRERARRGYHVGSRVLAAILPEHKGPSEFIPVDVGDPDEGSIDGIESRTAVATALQKALRALSAHDFDRVLTLGGECSVSVAPFAHLAEMYGDDLAVVWIDAHPDSDTPDTAYDGYHAMAAAMLLGHGDRQLISHLPATVRAENFAYAGQHCGEDDALANVRAWGPPVFTPDDLRKDSTALLDWLKATGAGKVAIHLDVDVVDSDEVSFGLGEEPGGLTRSQVNRLIRDVAAVADVVGLTIAEYVPRNLLQLQEMLSGLPLIGDDGLRSE